MSFLATIVLLERLVVAEHEAQNKFFLEVISKPIRQSWPIENVGQIQASAITASMFRNRLYDKCEPLGAIS